MAWHPLFRLRRLRAVRWLSARLDFPVRRLLPGFAFPLYLRFGPNISLLLASGRAEPAERALFRRLLAVQGTGCFWDVGANVGLYLFDYAGRRPGRPGLGLEPDPRNLDCLRRTARRVRLDSVELLAAAAAERAGRSSFHTDPLTGASGALDDGLAPFLQRHYGVAGRCIEVETVRLDDLLPGRTSPDLLKIDVEGGELAVLRGAPRLLSEVRPVILIELSERREETVALLLEAGYRLHDARTLAPLEGGGWNVLALPADGRISAGSLAAPSGAAPQERASAWRRPGETTSVT